MFLINSFNFNLLFLFCTGLSLFSLPIITRLRRKQTDPQEKLTIKGGPLLSRKALSPAIVAFMADMVLGALTAFFPLYAVKHGIANPGLFFGTFAITVVVGRALGGRIFDLHNREGVILPCLTIYIIAMSILFFFKTLPMFLVAAVIWGVGHAFLFPVLTAYTLDLTAASRGPAMGTFMALDDLGLGLGPVIMGIVLSLTNYPVMFLCLGFTGLLNLSYFYFFVRKKKKVDMLINESHFVE
jgi:MFS family permease